jgi:serpin B
MVTRPAGRKDRPSLARLIVLVTGICIPILVAGVGFYAISAGSANTKKTQVPVLPPGSQHTSFAPATATGAFGLDLMRTQAPGNLVLSPNSVAAALAMVGTGAAGRTAAQIANTLHLATPDAFGAVGQLQSTLTNEQASAGQGDPKAPTLDLANGLFLQEGFQVEPTFLSGLQQNFGAAPQAVNFSGDSSGSVKTINAWVSSHTNGIIPQILASLPETTRLALANAIYLKAAWLDPFEPKETSPAPFHNPTGSTSVEFMHETDRLSYGSGRGYKAVDLPYRASTLSLLVVLPVGKNVTAFQRQLGPSRLAQIAHNLKPRNVQLSLPRFHLTTQTELIPTLKALGMSLPFSDAAMFSRITTAESLKIGLVKHAADFKVDDAGTVAAAATVVGVEATSREVSPHEVAFNANRPFLFFLRDDRTGAVLFAGRLIDPASAGA